MIPGFIYGDENVNAIFASDNTEPDDEGMIKDSKVGPVVKSIKLAGQSLRDCSSRMRNNDLLQKYPDFVFISSDTFCWYAVLDDGMRGCLVGN